MRLRTPDFAPCVVTAILAWLVGFRIGVARPCAAAANRYNVNLPVASPAGSLAFMLLGSDYIVDLELSAAQAEGRGEIVSSPRVITANQKEATIEQGVEIPYQESASSGATTIQFKKAVLSLKVTPQITPDNRIILDLNVKKDSVGAVIVGSGGVNVPSIDTREITTQVLVNDGQTVVLGGILETERRDTVHKVPFLGDVPGLGLHERRLDRSDRNRRGRGVIVPCNENNASPTATAHRGNGLRHERRWERDERSVEALNRLPVIRRSQRGDRVRHGLQDENVS